MQHDNDPKRTSKSTSDRLKKNKTKILDWLSQSQDLNPIEMLWKELKRAVHDQKPSNVAELTLFWRDVGQIPQWPCKRLITSYHKLLTKFFCS